jgi:hypothetical protein
MGQSMDWNEYKTLCNQPFMFSRWMLEQTIELAQADPQLVDVLATVLCGRTLAKPLDHRGGEITDMFEVRLDLHHARAVHRLIGEAAKSGLHTVATRQRGLGGFVAAWRDYAQFIETHAHPQNTQQLDGLFYANDRCRRPSDRWCSRSVLTDF